MAERCAALGHADDTAGRRAVERATAAIVGARLAALSTGGNRSGAARYALRLAPVDNSESPPLSVVHSTEKAHRSASESPPLSVRKPTAERGAKEDRGDTEEETRERAPLPLICPRHPHGNASEPCRTCGDVRRARAALPTVSEPFTVQPGAAHPGIEHKRVPDGTCALCDARPEVVAADLAREGIAWPTTL